MRLVPEFIIKCVGNGECKNNDIAVFCKRIRFKKKQQEVRVIEL